MCGFKSMETQRLLIRTLEMKDKEAFFQYRSRPEVYEYQSWRPREIGEIESFLTKNRAVRLNARNQWLQLAVCLKDGTLIGDIGIHFLDDEAQVELGYTIAPEFQNRGYAREAVKGITGHLFSELGKHRVTASVDPDNLKSIKVLERIGFRKEAHFIKSFRSGDRWLDDCIYAFLAEEWR